MPLIATGCFLSTYKLRSEFNEHSLKKRWYCLPYIVFSHTVYVYWLHARRQTWSAMVNVLIIKVFFCCPNNKNSRYRLNLDCNLDQFALPWIALLVWKLTFLNTCQIVVTVAHVKWNTDTGSEVMHLGAAHHNLGTQSMKMWDWLKTVSGQYWRLLETLCWLSALHDWC